MGRFRLFDPWATASIATRRLDAHLEVFLDVQPVRELMIDLPAFSLEQGVETAVAGPHAAGGQVTKPDPKFGPTVANAHKAMRRTREAQRSAGATLADAVGGLQPLHHAVSTIGPYNGGDA